jgi:hypothetical protein
MSAVNPYQPTAIDAPNTESNAKVGLEIRFAAIGFVIGAMPAIGLGVHGLKEHAIQIASLAPGEAACGMPGLAAFTVICVIAPISGITAAASVWAAARLGGTRRSYRSK